VARYKNENGKHIVEFYDLRFGMIPNRTPFLLKIIFNGNGALDGVSLKGRTVRERF
jgi:hypothetical protein